jgi:Transcriptional Coactivator p15 (PC4)
MPHDLPVTIAEWQRNERDVIRVSLSNYNGTPVVDLRVWFRNSTGEFKPGRAGITLGVKQLPRIADALALALAAARERSLLPLPKGDRGLVEGPGLPMIPAGSIPPCQDAEGGLRRSQRARQ